MGFKFIISLYFRQGAGVARGKFSDKSGGMKLRLEYIGLLSRYTRDTQLLLYTATCELLPCVFHSYSVYYESASTFPQMFVSRWDNTFLNVMYEGIP